MDPGADIEGPVLAAWRLLGRGFAEAADGDPADDDSLAALEERSTVLLLRLLVAFVARSRGLTDRAGDDAMAADGDGDAVSAAGAVVTLEELRTEIREVRDATDEWFADAAAERSTAMWRRLEALFRLLDEGDESLGVPPYDGELFDTVHDELSTDDAVADRYLAAAIHRLSTIETDDGRTEPIDFAAVETRQLGSAYETLLEHRFRIGSAGELVVVDDDERKTTGTYYTPDDVVDYVVEETVGPLVDDIEDDLESDGLEPGTGEYLTAFHRRVTALRILDPAMGSGRFLARTLDFLVARVMDAAHETGAETALGEPRVRHDIAASCLYGVDRDELAVELATASLWLETLTTGQPPTGLDQHLEVGNALVGSDASTARPGANAARCDESASLGRRIELANVRTASRFGLELPDDALKRLGHAIDDDEAWADLRATDWFRAAQSMSDERGFFHWDLEFPEVFLDERGRPQPDAGFDAVIGNPPWVATAGRADISASMDRTLRAYLEERYTATRQQFDLYVAFCERFVRLAAAGRIGIVVPDAILAREQNVHLRRYLLDTTSLTTLLHLGTAFEGVENGTAVVATGADEGETKCAALEGETTVRTVDYTEIPQSFFREQDACRFLLHLDRHARSVLRKLDQFSTLGERVDISRGEEISKRAEFLAETDDCGGLRAIIPGSAVVPYGFDDAETRYVPTDEIEKDRRNYRSPKLVFRQTASKPIGALDSNDRVTIKSVYNIRTDGSEADLRRLLGVLNSRLLEYYHEVTHAAYRTVFPQINQATFESYPIAVPDAPEFDDLVAERISLTRERRGLTVDLRTQLGRYRDGDSLTDIGTCDSVAPPDSALRASGDELAGLRLGRVSVDRVAPDTVRIDATARYKPADGDRETDRWGYTETDPAPALRLSGLTKTEADLLEAFVPVAVDEADGFAGVRETATKTISLLDRLRALTVPVVDDVRDGLERYLETKTDAAELETRIEAIDRRIDELVYDCYGLTATEIETVEATLGEE